jgi:hypothetical protein
MTRMPYPSLRFPVVRDVPHNDKVAIFFAALPVARDVPHDDKVAFIFFAALPVARDVTHNDKSASFILLTSPTGWVYAWVGFATVAEGVWAE